MLEHGMLKTKLYKFIGVALLAFSLLTVGCGGGEERQEAYLARAQEYFDAGNFEKAKIEVKNVRQINPNNTPAIFLSGLIAEKEENFRGAFQSFS
jgi:Tfp pilus assembly protein PilF